MAKRKTIASPSLFEEPKKQEHEIYSILPDPPDTLPEILPLLQVPDQVQTEKTTEKSTKKTVTLRDGEILSFGDEVGCVYPGRHYEGKIFVITEMNDWEDCESGVLIVAVNKNNPQEFATSQTKGLKGLDANWFRKTNSGLKQNDVDA